MRFLALDVSTHTGYAVFEGEGKKLNLLEHGVWTRKVENYKADIKSFREFPEDYPDNFIRTAAGIADDSVKLAGRFDCKHVVIEHSEKGRQRLSQRLLEWMHLELVKALGENGIRFRYLLVSDWRKQVGCYLKHWPEYQKWNREVTAAKKKCTGRKLARIDGKVVSKINQKKLSIIIANQHFDIAVRDDNTADAVNLGRAAWELGVFGESR